MKLVILGNGFDISHNLKTSFRDFRNFLITNKKDSLVNKIDNYLLKGNPKFNKDDINLAWNDFEAIIGNLFPNYKNSPKIVEEFENTMEYFVEEFYQYLLKITNCKILPNNNIQTQIENADIILTFNYTDTYKNYTLPSHVDVFHIHGSLSKKIFPVIGYYIDKAPRKNQDDYSKRYNGDVLHKPAIAYKQNTIDLDAEIAKFKKRYKNSISEIVSIGYSYGESDIHVFDILNSLLVEQSMDNNIRFDIFESLNKIKYTIFNHDLAETKNIQKKLTSTLNSRYSRKSTVKVFGSGIRKTEQNIIQFPYINY